MNLSKLAPAELEALLINAYNAITVASILAHPGVTTIRDIDGVWDEAEHRVGGFEVTLDDIEHTLLRPFFRDPRIHFAVNCASASCAPLPRWAFDGATLDRQLDERARLFLSDPRNVRLEGGTLMLSRYFDWYGGDFTAEGWKPRAATIPEFVALYSTPEVAARIRVGGSARARVLRLRLGAQRSGAAAIVMTAAGRSQAPPLPFLAAGSVFGTNAFIRSSHPLTAGIQVSSIRSGSMRSSAARMRVSISP